MAEKKMLTMSQAYSNFWNKYFVFSGTAQRSEFWWSLLVNMIIGFFIGLFSGMLIGRDAYTLPMLFLLITLIPSLSQLARRCHDAGFSAWWLMMLLIPVVDFFVMLYIALVPTNMVKPNKFRK